MAVKAALARAAVAPEVRGERTVRYYIWDRVVRAGHWINFISLVALIFTGFYIGGPFFRPPSDEPFGASTMATMKNVHFLAGTIFALNGAFRAYWFWGGRTYRQWFRAHIWQAEFWREVWWKLKEYLTLRYIGHYAPTLDHNALASLTYTLLFLACAFISVTGFAMKGAINPDSWLNTFFGWVIPLFGGSQAVHSWHHLGMWMVVCFVILHVYAAIREEVMSRQSMLSAIISGTRTFKD